MRLAIGVEKKYTKNQILLGYLNIAFFGGRGLRHRVGRELLLRHHRGEAHPRAGGLPPRHRQQPREVPARQARQRRRTGPRTATPRTLSRRDYILDKMLEYDKITEDAARRRRWPRPSPRTSPSRARAARRAGGSAYFCDYVYWTIRNDEAFGATEAERLNLLKRGGLDVYTTIDPRPAGRRRDRHDRPGPADRLRHRRRGVERLGRGRHGPGARDDPEQACSPTTPRC